MVDKKLLNKVSDELKKQQLTLATAESCTGGFLSHTLTNISGSSAYFECGVVTYSNTAKENFLGIPKKLLTTYGAVSKQTAAAMAKSIRKRAAVDIGIATTGIAGPSGGTKEKPVGLVFIAIATKDDVLVTQFLFFGTRLDIKKSTCNAALNLLFKKIT